MTLEHRNPSAALSARVGKDLWPRVASGVVMAAVAIAAVAAGPVPLAALAAIVLTIAAWEWGHIVRGLNVDAGMAVQVVTTIAAIVGAINGEWQYVVIAILLGSLLTAVSLPPMRRAAEAARGATVPWRPARQASLSVAGTILASTAGATLVALRSNPQHGLAAVLFVCLAVACTDIGAYFAGRLIGGPKLWPAVSPNKTWAGLGGALLAAAAVGMVTAIFVPDAKAFHLAILGALFALVAQAGDLAESALKRHFGVKDASSLIPGHGGVMDRIDGLTAVLVAIGISALALQTTEPARALLTW